MEEVKLQRLPEKSVTSYIFGLVGLKENPIALSVIDLETLKKTTIQKEINISILRTKSNRQMCSLVDVGWKL